MKTTFSSLRTLAGISVISALLSACSLAPSYEQPALPVAAHWNADGNAAEQADAPHAASISWNDFFQDAQLKSLIATALDNNRDLRMATLNIERARAMYSIQAADQVPNVAAVGNGSRQRLPADVNPTGKTGVNTSYFAGVGMAAFEIDLFGRVRNLSEAALQRYLATEQAQRSAQISLIAAVATTYEALVADRRLLHLAEQTLASRADSYERQHKLYAEGASSEYDLRQSESLLEAAKAARAQQVRRKALDENALTVLVGQPLPSGIGASGADTDARAGERTLPDLPAGLPSELISARPDILQQEAILRAQNANIGAARAAFFPRISLTGNFGSASNELSGLFDSGSRSWAFIPQISIPIFEGGRNIANLKVAETDKKIAIAQYDKTVQVAFREVADALAGRATLAEEVSSVKAQENAETARYGFAKSRYEAGYSSYLEYLDAQRSLFSIQQQSIQVQLAELQNRITLYKVLGGGWKAPAP